MKPQRFRTTRCAALSAALLTLGSTSILPIAALSSTAAQAATVQTAASKTETFAIRNMTCAMCPITVRTAMEHVDGVKSVQVDFNAKTATVVFDPSRTTPKAIAAASTNAGYPATVKR